MSEHPSNEDLFKLFDRVKARYEKHDAGGGKCKHLTIVEGVCDVCCEVLWHEVVNNDNFYDRTIRRNVNTHNRGDHFYKFLSKREELSGEIKRAVLCDFEWFLRAYERIEKKRRNFLLNKWVLLQLLERRGVTGERCHIKNVKSLNEHRVIC